MIDDAEKQDLPAGKKLKAEDFDFALSLRKAVENPGGTTLFDQTLLASLVTSEAREFERQQQQTMDALKTANATRAERATAWKCWMKLQAESIWSGASDASHLSVSEMTERLLRDWRTEFDIRSERHKNPQPLSIPDAPHPVFEHSPITKATAETFINTVHAALWRKLGRG
jgi:hypothetical protein